MCVGVLVRHIRYATRRVMCLSNNRRCWWRADAGCGGGGAVMLVNWCCHSKRKRSRKISQSLFTTLHGFVCAFV